MQLKDKILTIRNQQVMLDRDLAELYKVETKVLNQAVKRNQERFPEDFCFQLTEDETISLRSQIVTLEKGRGKHRKFRPYVFTQEGIAALSGVLRSKRAISINIKIMRAFISMRQSLMQNQQFFIKFQQINQKLLEHDSKFNTIFSAMEKNQLASNEGIFFEEQLFTAHKAIQEILNKANKEVILIDNYIDENTLILFSESKVPITILTKNTSKKLDLAVNKFNAEFSKKIIIKEFNKSHDRFIILDKTTVYHIGASLKDAGKKWFAINKMKDVKDILKKIS